MSVVVKSVPLVTDGAGAASATVRAGGVILRAIHVEIGTLSTPDIEITEEPEGTTVLSVVGVAADTRYVPTMEGADDAGAAVTGSALPVPVLDRIQIAVTGGGDTKSGRVVLLLER